MPIEGVESGDRDHFEDVRISLLNDVIPVKGKNMLELGPYEGYQTYMLEKLGAASVTSIEANSLSYLKCLIVKDLFNLNVNLLHGDYREYLKNCNKKYDIVLASGVLYHMTDPIELINDIAKITDVLFIWTHCYPRTGVEFSYGNHFESDVPTLLYDKYKAYKQLYYTGVDYHAGSNVEYSMWLDVDSLYEALKDAGFKDINVINEGFDSNAGIVTLLIAKKSN